MRPFGGMRNRVSLGNLFLSILSLVLVFYFILYTLTSHSLSTPLEPPNSHTLEALNTDITSQSLSTPLEPPNSHTLEAINTAINTAISRLDQKIDRFVQSMDKRKFLALIPGFGPNNQYLGTKEALFIAKSLGRTFVAPNFFIHDNVRLDETSMRPFNLTFELQPLNGYTPTVTMEEFSHQCQGWADHLIWMREDTDEWWRRVGIYLNGTGIKVRNNIPAPEMDNFHPVLHSPEELKNYFKNTEEAPCVMIAFPFRNLMGTFSNDVQTVIPQYLIHASGIRKTASAVLNEINEKTRTGDPSDVISLHWRYGEITCKIEPAILHEGYDFCWGTAIFYWATIENIVGSLKKEVSKFGNLSGIFIATDVQEDEEIYKKFKKELLEKTGITPFRASDISILKSMEDNYYQSLVEQEICAISAVFVQSTGSTWSEYVSEFLISSGKDPKRTKVTSFNMLLDESHSPYTKRNCRSDKRPVSVNGAVVAHPKADPPHLSYFC